MQYRSKVSYYRLARLISFLSRSISFLLRGVSFLSRISFLSRRVLFPSRRVSFLSRSVSFLSRSVPFFSRSVSFLSRSVSFLSRSVSFLSRSVFFLSSRVSFLSRSFSLVSRSFSFLSRSVSFLSRVSFVSSALKVPVLWCSGPIWLARWTPDRAVLVGSLCCVLGQGTWSSFFRILRYSNTTIKAGMHVQSTRKLCTNMNSPFLKGIVLNLLQSPAAPFSKFFQFCLSKNSLLGLALTGTLVASPTPENKQKENCSGQFRLLLLKLIVHMSCFGFMVLSFKIGSSSPLTSCIFLSSTVQ